MENYSIWFAKGNMLVDLGRISDAIASYDQALKIKPDNHHACYNKT